LTNVFDDVYLGNKINYQITAYPGAAQLQRRLMATNPAPLHAAAGAGVNKHLHTKVVNGVLVIKFDSPNAKVNSLGAEVSDEFERVIKELETNPSVNSAVLISGKPGCFVAGADISMLESCQTAEDASLISHGAQIMFERMERSRKPIVAAINGVCLGGGLELALACHYRIGALINTGANHIENLGRNKYSSTGAQLKNC